MRAKHGIHIKRDRKDTETRARFVTSDYPNYELGSVTTLLKDLGLDFSKEQERSNPAPG